MSCRPHVVADFTAVSSSLNGFLMSLAMQEKFPKGCCHRWSWSILCDYVVVCVITHKRLNSVIDWNIAGLEVTRYSDWKVVIKYWLQQLWIQMKSLDQES